MPRELVKARVRVEGSYTAWSNVKVTPISTPKGKTLIAMRLNTPEITTTLTAEQARLLADNLHDQADTIEQTKEPKE